MKALPKQGTLAVLFKGRRFEGAFIIVKILSSLLKMIQNNAKMMHLLRCNTIILFSKWKLPSFIQGNSFWKSFTAMTRESTFTIQFLLNLPQQELLLPLWLQTWASEFLSPPCSGRTAAGSLCLAISGPHAGWTRSDGAAQVCPL